MGRWDDCGRLLNEKMGWGWGDGFDFGGNGEGVRMQMYACASSVRCLHPCPRPYLWQLGLFVVGFTSCVLTLHACISWTWYRTALLFSVFMSASERPERVRCWEVQLGEAEQCGWGR